MKKCSKCGKINIDEAIFCADCGSKLDEDSSIESTETCADCGSKLDEDSSIESTGIGTVDSVFKPNKDMQICCVCGAENPKKALFCKNCTSYLLDEKNIEFNRKLEEEYSDTISEDSNKEDFSDNSNSPPSASSADNSKASSPKSGTDQNTEEGPDKLKICCCYVPIILLVISTVWALIYHGYAESFDTRYPSDFKNLDLNGDGKLSFEEISQAEWLVDDSSLEEYFNEADTNHNGYLKGHEFDIFGDDILNHDSASSTSSSSSGSSSKGRDYSSGSNKYSNNLNSHEYDRSEGYILTCPYCGSESVYETGGYYRCAECGSNIYNPDDLELGYWEGYMELSAPISLI